ncbi:hypothetical protein BpOF4_10470 [Alkalihalophilus pseudofirmus OF4]|jgi:hypothetical protein|uniref:Uncharacterized protein n=3 Tax=Alkalihalophilus TaxID=2893060 RepID=D3FUH7_ALKPO|nr:MULTISPECIES: hypothetical protein [Alkalihalophilus]ADC50147.1 hypothetical protein BpOF4_10470 [Alkalihalophilus pseudofirmus OF4]ERN51502.1 hypothetical protein A33I_02145 [Alkalihalophilus marmarensis DSM 21297]MCM3490286.1 hypothetical protein [Alkalihalophilus marmarensis]MDV2886613.1 hypothetical protein [Alkalihalophilus pseudofirmus]MED1599895.1 hypothetical protein [Alkalihalophilus marmarensis]
METNKFQAYLNERLEKAKQQFERTIDCKHTEFDDLYPYMTEQPQFFWYKRYVAWQELLTVVSITEDNEFDWKSLFTDKQKSYIESRILDAKVLDDWYEMQEEKEAEQSAQNE